MQCWHMRNSVVKVCEGLRTKAQQRVRSEWSGLGWHWSLMPVCLTCNSVLAQAEKEPEAPKEAEQMDTDAQPAGDGAQTGTEAGEPQTAPEVSEPMAE